MSFKEFSSAHNAPTKNKSDDKSKDAVSVDESPVQPDKTPAEVASKPKSS